MTDEERAAIIAGIEKLISTDTPTIPQSVVFRTGVNTGLRMAKRCVQEFTEGNVKDADRV